MKWFDEMKDKVSQKWSEFTDEIWGPDTSLGQMMEASAAINTQMESLNFKLSKREIAFGLYLDAHDTQIARRGNLAIDAEAHAGSPTPPSYLVEVLLWYVDFVDWAYGAACNQFDSEHRGTEEDQLREKLDTRGYELVTLELEPRKDKPAHFIAFNHADKLCLLVVCGTKSAADGLTNATVLNEELYEGGPVCHQGMARGARWIAERYRSLFSHVFAPAQYKLVCCGHSLGAGTAALVTMLMNAKYNLSSECFAFATPACVSATSTVDETVTTVVLRDDIVPRASVYNVYQKLVELRQLDWNEVAKGKWIEDSLRQDVSDTEFVLEKATSWARNSMTDIAEKNKTRDPLTPVEGLERLIPPGNIIHLYQAEHENVESYHASILEADSPVLSIRGSYGMMADHKIEGYKEALEAIHTRQAGPQTPVSSPRKTDKPRPPPPPPPQKTWKVYMDHNTGKNYYHCVETGETTWEPQEPIVQ